ncbi:hypothetical protein Sta7437_2514 [Stanieria cyanosphaera PCC 7437]|uniref:DGQHR domain protein n=1 Tax=Stanieria cyanosphaera (strain ATCC 29371 / PCC 7437) TaxID=111780 RepID=K9XWK5_STAC7|nr:hypothetical protein [Stanieria cyanosphaera]AFZ36047.1 hypothetical protein Sta7437_2514 [Stanieria cyanosphaera PCC 7437]
MPIFRYKAIRVRQTDSGDWLVLFAASAVEIDIWSGVPQKKTIGTQETTGFQREENRKRIKEISSFYQNEQNIIQNPLLCALRKLDSEKIKFEPNNNQDNDDAFIQHGYLTITTEQLEELSLLELLKKVKVDLECRLPELAQRKPSDNLIQQLKQRAEIGSFSEEFEDEMNEEQDVEISDTDENMEISLTDESHILDFWEEIAAYVTVLEEIKDNFDDDNFLNYSKKSLISFLHPIVVVDGQHRLRAAVKSAKEIVKKEDKYKEKIEEILFNQDIDPNEVQQQIETEAARKLPVSLLMNNDPAEQVFQFVVVNQKATPIKPALLGTIISTSLSNEELERVSDRLENAGIKLEESRAVTFLARYPDSPFYGLVERGLNSDQKDNLKWNVLASIVKIFRDLKGGKLFHESVDYADKWKRTCLDSSNLVQEWQAQEFNNAYEYWRALDGCWREVFISFWTIIRDQLADRDNDEAWHYWGNPKQSNIFNKTSLTILAADFFQYLCERRVGIDEVSQIQHHVDQWLEGVNRDYFNRDWNLHGVKKDVPGIRKQWSKLWVEYRKDPKQLPRSNQYRVPLN